MTKIALITGANRGLGFETARRLGRSGARTIIGARDAAKGEQAADELRDEGIDARSVAIDVNSASSVQAAAKQVREQHGRLDILVNNAGILPEATADELPRPVDLGMFRRTFETNVFGVVAVIQEFLPLLRESDAGRIVNVSSTMGSLTEQSDPSSPWYEVVVPAYISSKAALNGITVELAKFLRDTPTKVNSICPGWVQTDLGGPDNRAAGAADRRRGVSDRRRAGPDRRRRAHRAVRRSRRKRRLVTAGAVASRSRSHAPSTRSWSWYTGQPAVKLGS